MAARDEFATMDSMQRREQRVSWASDGSAIIRDVGELDSLLDRLFAEHGPDNPIIAIVDGPCEESVYLGIGGDTSFVSSTEVPYLTTVGTDLRDGEIDYFFQGHHSQVSRKQLIPAQVARKIVREFFSGGVLPSWQEWEPLGPDKSSRSVGTAHRTLPTGPVGGAHPTEVGDSYARVAATAAGASLRGLPRGL